MRDAQSAKHMWNAVKNDFEVHTLLHDLRLAENIKVSIGKIMKILTFIYFVKQLAYALQSI